MQQPKRVMVTGGAGFIGSHIVDALIARGHQVAVLDDLSTGSRDNVDPRAAFYLASVTDRDSVDRAFREFTPQLVNHHAAQISVTRSGEDPLTDANVNVLGSLIFLEASRRHRVEHFTFASTGGALYGEPPRFPCDEATPVKPIAPYGAAKYAVETYLHVYRAAWNLKSVALRYANVYGPRQSPLGEAGVIAIFAHKMLRRESPTVFGDGEQTRDFIYVGDVVEANMLCMERQLEGAFNIGTGVATSVNQLVRLLSDACGYQGPVSYQAARPGDVQHIALDSRLFASRTGWRSLISLAEGMRLTVGPVPNQGRPSRE